MKKIVLTTILSIIIALPLLAQKSENKVKFYHAVEFDYHNEIYNHITDINKINNRNGPSLNFLFGAKFGDHVALAAGLGITCVFRPIIDREAFNNLGSIQGQYIAPCNYPAYCDLYYPLYLSLRYYILKNRKWTPLIAIDGGARLEWLFSDPNVYSDTFYAYFWNYLIGGQISAVRRFKNDRELYFGIGMSNINIYSISLKLGVKL